VFLLDSGKKTKTNTNCQIIITLLKGFAVKKVIINVVREKRTNKRTEREYVFLSFV